ncbi:MAG: hypothetical protein FWE34_08075 [Defluviitaleaceae bacterium]|nr:hypothetical protein [Defluviitaleaceae bacterium]
MKKVNIMKKRILLAFMAVMVMIFYSSLALTAGTYDAGPSDLIPECCVEMDFDSEANFFDEENIGIRGSCCGCGCWSGSCCGSSSCGLCHRPSPPPEPPRCPCGTGNPMMCWPGGSFWCSLNGIWGGTPCRC